MFFHVCVNHLVFNTVRCGTLVPQNGLVKKCSYRGAIKVSKYVRQAGFWQWGKQNIFSVVVPHADVDV